MMYIVFPMMVIRAIFYRLKFCNEINLEALLDVRSVKKSNSHTTKAVSNVVVQAPNGGIKDDASKQLSSSNDPNMSKSSGPFTGRTTASYCSMTSPQSWSLTRLNRMGLMDLLLSLLMVLNPVC
ncbi:uncharacterized protein [Rutidosis leptorrhynchoides]|uniref:uncharacterized protein n=1 Tax=Rutidosis leptorrhynchoides TaxID=125765 RepID=UPI003A99E69F